MFISKKRYEGEIEALNRQLSTAREDYDSLQKLLSRVSKDFSETRERLKVAEEKVETLTTENNSLKKKNSEYEAGVAGHGDRTQATLYISSDLSTVTPVTKVNPDDIKKMTEMGYLPSNMRDDPFAVNLAALTIAHEALEQMVYTFEESIVSDIDTNDVGFLEEEIRNES